jgi:hypothetical protein
MCGNVEPNSRNQISSLQHPVFMPKREQGLKVGCCFRELGTMTHLKSVE